MVMVREEDREIMMKLSACDYMKERLQKEDGYSYRYQVTPMRGLEYFEMRIVRARTNDAGHYAIMVIAICFIMLLIISGFIVKGCIAMDKKKKRLSYRASSILVSLVLIFIARYFQISNPMMLLIIPVIYFAFVDGYISGGISAVIVGAYSLVFFSSPGQLFSYDFINLQKVGLIVAALVVIVVLIGQLKAKLAAAESEQAALRTRNEFLSRMSHAFPKYRCP